MEKTSASDIDICMDIDIDVLDKIVERVEGDVIDRIKQVPIQKLFR